MSNSDQLLLGGLGDHYPRDEHFFSLSGPRSEAAHLNPSPLSAPTQKAREYLQLDAGSEWANYVMPSILLREGKAAEAREAVKKVASVPRYHRDLLEAATGLRPPAELDDPDRHRAELLLVIGARA